MTNPNPPDEPNKELIDLKDRVKRLEDGISEKLADLIDRVKRLEDEVFNGGGGTGERLKQIIDAALAGKNYATKADLDKAYEILGSFEEQVRQLGGQTKGQTWPPGG